MPTVHYLNVKEGDCSIIQHSSGNVSVIDVCNAENPDYLMEMTKAIKASDERGINGNFQQKKYPVNPISYLTEHGVSRVFRYIQTHPDMDHMDGIKAFFEKFEPANFWDTDNKKEMDNASWQGSPYNEDDWKYYKQLRDQKSTTNPTRLTLLSGAIGQFYNVGSDGTRGGDGLMILAPTQELVDSANESNDEYNSCSYVVLYRTGQNRILFSGDSHDETWEHILGQYSELLTNVDLLIAPHHGRASGRSYEFLDALNPTLTFFGNAKSEHLAYGAWSSRGLSIVTNNQAGSMIVDASTSPMTLYVTNKNYARVVNSNSFYSDKYKGWYLGPITESLIP